MGCNYYIPYVDKKNMSTSFSSHSKDNIANREKKKNQIRKKKN